MDLGVGLVERDLQLAIAADEGHPGLARVVEEDELVALARDEAAPLYLAVVEQSIAQFWFVLPVVEAADHVGPADVAELEGHQDLVIHFRDEVRAAGRPGG